MKRLPFACAIAVLCVFSATLAVSQGGSVEQELKALSDQAVQAYLKADTSFAQKYYADDATIIHSDGKLLTKMQEIESLKSSTLKYESIIVRERNIRGYGNTGIVTTLTTTKATIGGKPLSGDFRSTRVWVKQNGNWKLVLFQATRAPAANQ